MRSLVEEVTTRFSRSETVLPYASIEAQERSATVLQLYCNRTDMYWYRIEKATPQDYRKSPKKARFPYASGRARTCASKLVMRRGQRFESAPRLSFLPANPPKMEAPDVRVRGLSAVDYSPKASSIPSAACRPMLGIQWE